LNWVIYDDVVALINLGGKFEPIFKWPKLV